MAYPLKGQYARITTSYGERSYSWSCDKNAAGQGVHTGADFAAPYGTPIYAPCDGTIRHRSYGSEFGSHQFAISPTSGQAFAAGEIFFAHTSSRPADGTEVTIGQPIADVGGEGNVTGPHLHMEYHPDSKNSWSCSVHADPQPVLDLAGGSTGGSTGGSSGGSSSSSTASYRWAAKVKDSGGHPLEVHSVVQLPDKFGGRYDKGVAVIGIQGGETSVYLHTDPGGLVIGNMQHSFRRMSNSTPSNSTMVPGYSGGAPLGRLVAQRYGKYAYALFGNIGGPARILRFSNGSRQWLNVAALGVVAGGGSAYVTDHAEHPRLWVQSPWDVSSFQDTGAGRANPSSQVLQEQLDGDVLACRLAPPLNRRAAPQLWWFVKRPRGGGFDIAVYRAKWQGDGFDTTWRTKSNLVGTVEGLSQISDAPSIHVDRRFTGAMEISLVGIKPSRIANVAGATYWLTIDGGFLLSGLYEQSPQLWCPGFTPVEVRPFWTGFYEWTYSPFIMPDNLLVFHNATYWNFGIITFSSVTFDGATVAPIKDAPDGIRTRVVGGGWPEFGGYAIDIYYGDGAGGGIVGWANQVKIGGWYARSLKMWSSLPDAAPPGQPVSLEYDANKVGIEADWDLPNRGPRFITRSSDPMRPSISIGLAFGRDTYEFAAPASMAMAGVVGGNMTMSLEFYATRSTWSKEQTTFARYQHQGGADYGNANVDPMGWERSAKKVPWIYYGQSLLGIGVVEGWTLSLVRGDTEEPFEKLYVFLQSGERDQILGPGSSDSLEPSSQQPLMGRNGQQTGFAAADLPVGVRVNIPLPAYVMEQFREGSVNAFSFYGEGGGRRRDVTVSDWTIGFAGFAVPGWGLNGVGWQ